MDDKNLLGPPSYHGHHFRHIHGASVEVFAGERKRQDWASKRDAGLVMRRGHRYAHQEMTSGGTRMKERLRVEAAISSRGVALISVGTVSGGRGGPSTIGMGPGIHDFMLFYSWTGPASREFMVRV